MKNKMVQGCLSLVITVAMMFVVVFGVRTMSPSTGSDAADSAAQSTDAGGAGAFAEAADGTYTGTAAGFGGDVTAEVTIANGAITEVKLTGDNETQGVGSNAIEQLPEKIVEAQSPDVDAVAGASISSAAVKEAVKNALIEAGVSEDSLS